MSKEEEEFSLSEQDRQDVLGFLELAYGDDWTSMVSSASDSILHMCVCV